MRSREKGKDIVRSLVSEPITGEAISFPMAAQIARVSRQRPGQKTETVCLITSRPEKEMPPAQWLESNINHWGVETGLHARLDASKHDDRCRLRNDRPLRLHAIFTRVTNSLCCQWLSKKKRPEHHTTTDFIRYMSEEHDRRAISLVTVKKGKI